jgi:hypothetical protein
MGKGHVDGGCHRCDVTLSLGQHVPTLEGCQEAGRELVDRHLCRQATSVLKPSQSLRGEPVRDLDSAGHMIAQLSACACGRGARAQEAKVPVAKSSGVPSPSSRCGQRDIHFSPQAGSVRNVWPHSSFDG